MKIDILVLTHNHLDVTKRFTDALYENTENFHLYILDNGSRDGTVEWLRDNIGIDKKYNKVNFKIKCSSENLGVVKGRNSLYEFWKENRFEDHSDYVLFLDNDQMVWSGWLESYEKKLIQGYDIIGWEAWQQYEEYPRKFRPFRKSYREDDSFSYVGCGGMMIRNEIIDKIGLFDERFSPAYFEDPDFCYRAYDMGYKIGWNPTNRIIHVEHSTLGDLDWRDNFVKSFYAFKNKWHDRNVPRIPNI